VTGAAKGIGYAIAQRLGKEGAAVMVSDIDDTAAATAVDYLTQQGINAAFQHCDVSDSKQVCCDARTLPCPYPAADVNCTVYTVRACLTAVHMRVLLLPWDWHAAVTPLAATVIMLNHAVEPNPAIRPCRLESQLSST
jgi:NAD(P)-dependent dehydrogenase (short-subunit alcohol dehydrogenase family)